MLFLRRESGQECFEFSESIRRMCVYQTCTAIKKCRKSYSYFTFMIWDLTIPISCLIAILVLKYWIVTLRGIPPARSSQSVSRQVRSLPYLYKHLSFQNKVWSNFESAQSVSSVDIRVWWGACRLQSEIDLPLLITCDDQLAWNSSCCHCLDAEHVGYWPLPQPCAQFLSVRDARNRLELGNFLGVLRNNLGSELSLLCI